MFFQNIYSSKFVGSVSLNVKEYNPNFTIDGNVNRPDQMVGWNYGPYDFTGNNLLTFNFSLDGGKYYSAFTVTLPNTSGVIAQTVVDTLVANSNFDAWFKAYTIEDRFTFLKGVGITTKKDRLDIKSYISNGSAEFVLGINRKAQVKELPSYFARHTVQNAPVYPDSQGVLIYLDPLVPTDATVITNAGLNPLVVKPDWQLMDGMVDLYTFYINTFDGSNRITQTIEMLAGSKAGDWGRRIQYTYIGVSTVPNATYQTPYVLTSGDIAAAIPPP